MAKFKTRARAIDLLGRQQIAGIPTAINELFKNAHDAYADHVDVDYFRKQKLFVLRDDGLGMTKDDFLNRWLVLGTESKFDNKRIQSPPIDPNKPLRPVMGEKGIGRLAIAAIGKQTLILSRASRENKLQNAVAALINWGIFEIPGLDLDEVVIPLREFEKGIIPDESDIESMKKELIDSIANLNEKKLLIGNEAKNLITEVMDFKVDPILLCKKLPGDLSLTSSSGTHFYIYPANESLNYDIDGNPNDKGKVSKLEKFLTGFTNTMTPNHPEPNIEASFRDYRAADDTYEDLIDKENFFTPDEFKKADHHVTGNFDEYGQFEGNVIIYNQENISHKISWSGNNFKPTKCGPFSIEFSYLQGKEKHSYLDPISWSQLSGKLNRLGGLYIYKDGIRILPYGDTDYDFLDIERNRTKSARYYFFSYRRMFGVINISKTHNPHLIEKSGREGFIENKAYKQIQEILKNFFEQLTIDFFREQGSGEYVELWKKRRDEREKFYKAKEEREKRAKERKNKFQKELVDFFDKIESDDVEKQLGSLYEFLNKKLASIASINDPDKASKTLIDNEIDARSKLIELRKEYKINAPRGFAISQDLRKDWEAYQDQYLMLEDNFFSKAEKEIANIVQKHQKELHIKITKRKRIEKALEHLSIEAKEVTRKKREEARSISEDMAGKVRKLTQELMANLEQRIREVQMELTSLKVDEESDADIYEELKRRELPIIEEKEYANSVLENIIDQIDSIYWEKDETGKIITNKQIEDSMEEEIGELKEKIVSDVELTQLGLAVNIVHHEFNSTVTSLRSSIRDLKRWADVDEKLETIYGNIRANFEHLDGYLSLLTPFNRRLYRKAESIKAEDIYIFLLDVFRGRLERHNVSIKRTKLFTASKLKGYRSVFYPVFVNIVDNAIYWLKQKQDDTDRIIRLHADHDGAFYISNNGPIIKSSDIEKIFELGFSRKENGRGMGLAISREVLQSIGYEITVDSPRKNSTVTFKIFEKQNK